MNNNTKNTRVNIIKKNILEEEKKYKENKKNNENEEQLELEKTKKDNIIKSNDINIENKDDFIEQDKEFKIKDIKNDKFNIEFFLLFAFIIMIGIDIYNVRIDYFNLPLKKILKGGYTDDYGVGGIKGVRSEFFGPNITPSVQIRYGMFIILFFLLVVSISIPFSLLIALITVCYIYAKKNIVSLIGSFSNKSSK